MFLADYHTHSSFSGDGQDRISDMLAVAERRGLAELCITDHCDMELQEFDRTTYWKLLSDAEKTNQTAVKLLRGIEVGEGFWFPEKCERLLSSDPYDFVIGSVHALKSGYDIYCTRYKSRPQCYEILEEYWQETAQLAEWGVFDVLGHLTYPLRYMTGRDGISLPDFYERYEDTFRRIFAILCRKGMGIEVNLSGLRRPGGIGTMPGLEIVKLYRRCGGEIITLGSDAHTAGDVGTALREGIALLRQAGFTYVTAYEGRKPRMEPIE